MKKTFLILLLSLTYTIVYCQTVTIKVVDSDTELPIFRAHIKVGKEVFLTNKQGIALVNVKSNKKAEVSHIKYHKKFIELKKTRTLTVYLNEKQQKLDEVVITSKRNLKKYLKFTKLAKMPKSIHSFGSVIKGDKLYTFGGDGSDYIYSNRKGLNEALGSDEGSILQFLTKPKPINFYKYRRTVFAFDFNKETWETKNIEPKARAYHNAILHNNNVYLLGGKRLTLTRKKEMLMPQIEVLNLQNDSIKVDEMNPHQGVNAATVIFEDKLLVIGGSLKLQGNGLKKYSDKIHFYDFKTGYWYLLTTMSKGKETSAIIVNKKLYLFGGSKNKKLTEIESFNLITGKWEKEGALFTAMEKPAITKHQNTVYLFEKDRIVTFNAQTKELKEFRINLPLYFSQIHVKNDNLYIVGGTIIRNFENRPQKSFIKISLDEFYNTSIRKSKTL